MKSNSLAANKPFPEEIPKKSWWNRRTSVEKFLVVLALLSSCCLFVVAFSYICITYRTQSGILVSVQRQEKSLFTEAGSLAQAVIYTSAVVNATSPRKGRCSTKRCIRELMPIFRNMDPNLSPCEDFYEYACGKYQGYNETFGLTYTHINVAYYDIRKKILGFIDRPVKKEDSELLIKMKRFYNSCKNETKLRRTGFDFLEEIVNGKHNLPVVKGDRWRGSRFSWTDTMVRCKQEHPQFMAFIDVRIDADIINKSRHFLMLSPIKSRVPQLYDSKRLNNDDVTKFLEQLIHVAMFLGAREKRAQEEMKEVLQFEMLLDLIIPLPADEWYELRNLSYLQESRPEANWKYFLEKLIGVQLEDNEPIWVEERYLMNLFTIMNITKPRTLANYAIMEMAFSLLWPLSKHSSVKQSDKCLNYMINEVFTDAVNHEYIKTWISSRAQVKIQTEELVSLIMEEMRHLLQRIDWLDQETRTEAQKKLSSIYSVVVYPEEILDYDRVAKIYENFTVSEDNFLENIINYRRISQSALYSLLRKPVSRNNWKKRELTEINAFYTRTDNSITIPAGYLYGFMFDEKRPAYMNFAAIGSVIGHEIGHAFDYRGHMYDEDGLYRDWWDSETKEKFHERAQCMIDQYSNFTSPVTRENLNGETTIAENIADNAGVKLAYYAYQEWVKRHGREQSMKEFTPNQLFWLSYANVYCTDKYRETFTHSPERFRVNGPLANFPEFAKDFECPPDSNMNPRKQCTVW